MKLGFIGLGVMGRPMALNLIKGGHEMAVYARRPETAQPLVSSGARVYNTPADLAAHVEVIFTIVTNSSDVEEIVLGKDGVIHGAASGSVLVDMETISPVTVRKVADALAAKGIDMLDAPVSGGPMGAEQGTLSIMVGGKPHVFERVKPLFQCMGKTIVHVGDHGAGQITKACNQLALLVTAQGTAEALTLAHKLGVDPAKVRDVMMGGVAASRVLELFGKRMIERKFENGIDTRLYHKDLDIVLGLAHELGMALPAAALTMQGINALIGRGEGRKDLSALIRIVEDLNGGRAA
jgi:2-hydroxy-3-oxopropionate reductase